MNDSFLCKFYAKQFLSRIRENKFSGETMNVYGKKYLKKPGRSKIAVRILKFEWSVSTKELCLRMTV